LNWELLGRVVLGHAMAEDPPGSPPMLLDKDYGKVFHLPPDFENFFQGNAQNTELSVGIASELLKTSPSIFRFLNCSKIGGVMAQFRRRLGSLTKHSFHSRQPAGSLGRVLPAYCLLGLHQQHFGKYNQAKCCCPCLPESAHVFLLSQIRKSTDLCPLDEKKNLQKARPPAVLPQMLHLPAVFAFFRQCVPAAEQRNAVHIFP
jgi:hypothetical protein